MAKPATSRKPATAKRHARPAPASALPAASTLAIGTALVGLGAAFIGAFAWFQSRTTAEGHSAADLMGDEHPGPDHRAPEAFRPDMDAPMTAAEREALRPPVGEPTLTAGAVVG